MGILLIFALLMPCVIASQSQGEANGSDIQILEVSCTRARVRESQSEPLAFPSTTPDPNNSNTIQRQSEELSKIERNAAQGRTNKTAYIYAVKIKNVGLKTVISILWDYRANEPSDQENVSTRRFLCSANIRPDKTAELKAFSNSPPVRVVSATPSGKGLAEKAIVDRVEYQNGSVWQRPDLNISAQAKDALSKIIRPGCVEVH